jgi:hypothetical protein
MGQGQREEATLTSTDAVPTRRMEERLEENRSRINDRLECCAAPSSAAKYVHPTRSSGPSWRSRATPEAQQALRAACEPATLVELGECIETLIQSISQGDPAGSYCTTLTMDVGSLEPSRGALEAACRWLRTAAMFRPRFQKCSPQCERLASFFFLALST